MVSVLHCWTRHPGSTVGFCVPVKCYRGKMLDCSMKEIQWNLTSTAILQLCTWPTSSIINFGGRPASFLRMQEAVISMITYTSKMVLSSIFFPFLPKKNQTSSSWQCNPCVKCRCPQAQYNFFSLTIKKSLQDFLFSPKFDNYPQFQKVQFPTQVLARPSAAALLDIQTACICIIWV